jgi:hypothetical protein
MGSFDRRLVSTTIFILLLSCRHSTLYTKKSFVFFSKIYNLTSLYGPIASGASVDPISEVLSTAMLVLQIYEIEKFHLGQIPMA